MKHLVPMLAAALLLWTPCGLQARTSGTNTGTQAATSVGQGEQYEKQVNAKLRELDREINDLKARLPREGQELRKELTQQVAELDEKRAEARRELEKLNESSQQAWQDAKPKLDAALKDLEAAYKRAAADFK
jgi:chromosome segregation ATPase